MGPQGKLVLEPFRFSYFDDKYDFYKPNMNTEAPVVDGKLSTKMYTKSLDYCYEGLRNLMVSNGLEFNLESFDYFCFHCPFSI